MNTTALLADWHGHHPWWPLLWLAVIGLLIYAFTRRNRRGPNADAILAERYARGEISVEEYRERRANLK